MIIKTFLKKADERYRSHKFPSKVLEWTRIYNKINCETFLTPNEYLILYFLVRNMWTNNLVQVSQNDILKYTTLSSKGVVNTAIHNLLQKGCIAIKFMGNNREKTVYMINPLIATLGVEHKNSLAKIFWELTGTKFGQKKEDTIYSDAQNKWDILTSQTLCYAGRNSIEDINFNEIKEKTKHNVEKKGKSKSKDFDNISESAEDFEEDLPY